MKILLICDRPSWAYDRIATEIKNRNDRQFSADIFYVKNNTRSLKRAHKHYDFFFVIGWQVYAQIKDGKVSEYLSFLDKKRTLVGLHSHHSWDGKRTLPSRDILPARFLIEYLQLFVTANAVSLKLYRLFADAGLNNISYTPNGVDEKRFSKIVSYNPVFTCGYSGSKKHDWRKGVSEFIVPACKKANVTVKLAMPHEGLLVPLDEMPAFYQSLNAYICASSSEGFSLSVLEAASCGVPIITTDVGGVLELIDDGKDGFIVRRDVDAICEKITYLKDNPQKVQDMGRLMRQKIEARFSWSIRIKAWLDFIERSINSV